MIWLSTNSSQTITTQVKEQNLDAIFCEGLGGWRKKLSAVDCNEGVPGSMGHEAEDTLGGKS